MFALVTAVLALTGTPGLPAAAAAAIPRVVSPDPVDWTPHVADGEVWAMVVVGDTVVVGGHFGAVTSADQKTRYARSNLMAFRLSDGRVTDFAPDLDGTVYALAAGPDGSVFVGGDFTGVDGTQQQHLARLDVASGELSAEFTPAVSHDVRALAVDGTRLYAGGRFKTIDKTARLGLARLDTASGRLDTGFDARLTPPSGGRVKVEDLAVSPDGSRLVAVGALTGSLGQRRAQLVMLNVAGPAAELTDWTTSYYGAKCDRDFNTYLRAVDFSPDGRYFVAVTTGHDSTPRLPCDTAARFDLSGRGAHQPTWINHTGGNSLYAVAVTGSAVYVGGHLQWLDNPHGHKNKGPGAVERKGIAAIDPDTGRALPWNPTRSRGEGLRAFVVSSRGLLVGSDTDQLGHEYHGRVGLFPTAP